jgi:hypothetical protein
MDTLGAVVLWIPTLFALKISLKPYLRASNSFSSSLKSYCANRFHTTDFPPGGWHIPQELELSPVFGRDDFSILGVGNRINVPKGA